MTAFVTLLETTLNKVLLTFAHNWPFLLASIAIGTLIKLYLDKDRVAGYLQRHQKGSIVLATAVAVGTPLCSCGTTAIVIGMMASMMPWAPIVAFLVSSPLSSPEGMFYTAGLFGWPFALAAFIASILLGLAGGLVAGLLDKTGWLKNQARMAPAQVVAAAAVPESMPSQATWGCQPTLALPIQSSYGSQSTQPPQPIVKPRVTLKIAGQQLYQDSFRLLVMFFGFAFLGYLLNGLIPPSWITSLFGSGHAYSVPLAATFGLPFYINSEASLPLVRAMLDSGMSQGAALAFLLAGSGTSIGAIGGALTIARWRVIAIVIGSLWIGSMVIGLFFDLFLASGLI